VETEIQKARLRIVTTGIWLAATDVILYARKKLGIRVPLIVLLCVLLFVETEGKYSQSFAMMVLLTIVIPRLQNARAIVPVLTQGIFA